MSTAEHAKPFGSQYKPPVKGSADLSRVLAIQRRPMPDSALSEALIQHMSAKYARKNVNCKCSSMRRPCVTKLRRAQAWPLYEIDKAQGLLGQIGVGHGKTLLGLLAPFALKVPAGEVVVLLVPPSNVGEIIDDYKLMSQHFKLTSLTVHGRSNFTTVVPGTPALHVLPYSLLSRPEYTAWMTQVHPVAILADECDKLRNLDTATTARVERHIEANPETKFCGWTGSLTDSSISDYAHLLKWALGANSPLPLSGIVTSDWGRALNPSPYPAPGGALMALCEPGESLTEGYKRRFTETLGVVSIMEAAISTPLVITKRIAPPLPTVIKDAFDLLRGPLQQRPDGADLIDSLEVAACASQLACGFYYRWRFPHGESEDLIGRWYAARKLWGAELREFVGPRIEGRDSMKLATDAAKRYWQDIETKPGDHVWQAEHWPAWRDIEPQVRPVKGQAVRLSDFLAQDAADWGLRNRGIVWYGHRELGKWIAELSGLSLHGGGPKARELILAETGKKSIIASIKSHGRGRNGLQFMYNNQLIASPPSSATAWEQLLGRLHRTGQEAGQINAQYYAHTPEFKKSVEQALLRAEYVNTTMGAAQKILTAGVTA